MKDAYRAEPGSGLCNILRAISVLQPKAQALDRHLLTEQVANETRLRNKVTEARLLDVFSLLRLNKAFLTEAQGDVMNV